jgi:hypothetical protein
MLEHPPQRKEIIPNGIAVNKEETNPTKKIIKKEINKQNKIIKSTNYSK